MLWNDFDHYFCEGKLFGLPEYYNAITALFIAGFGIYGLMNTVSDLYIDILYSSLTVTGFGSIGYHLYGNIGWALFDEIPMIVTIFIGIIYTDTVYYNYIDNNSSKNIIFTKKIKILFYLFVMYFYIIINTMSNYRYYFPILFGLTVIYLFYKIFSILYLLKILDNNYIKSNIFNKVIYSLLTIGISCLIWVITENLCNYIKYNIFLIGHPLWHFFIGHGFYNLIQTIYYIKLNNQKYKINYNKLFLLNINYSEGINI
jgi:hypothetical protein